MTGVYDIKGSITLTTELKLGSIKYSNSSDSCLDRTVEPNANILRAEFE